MLRNENIMFLYGFNCHLDYAQGYDYLQNGKIKHIHSFSGMTIPEVFSEVNKFGLQSESLVIASLAAIRVLSGVSDDKVLYFIPNTVTLKDLSNMNRLQRVIIYNKKHKNLNDTQHTLLKLLNNGFTLSEISIIMDRSVKNISYQKNMAMHKLNVKTNIELYFKAKLLGII